MSLLNSKGVKSKRSDKADSFLAETPTSTAQVISDEQEVTKRIHSLFTQHAASLTHQQSAQYNPTSMLPIPQEKAEEEDNNLMSR